MAFAGRRAGSSCLEYSMLEAVHAVRHARLGVLGAAATQLQESATTYADVSHDLPLLVRHFPGNAGRDEARTGNSYLTRLGA